MTQTAIQSDKLMCKPIPSSSPHCPYRHAPAAPLHTVSCRPSTGRMPPTASSADTKCISEVPVGVEEWGRVRQDDTQAGWPSGHPRSEDPQQILCPVSHPSLHHYLYLGWRSTPQRLPPRRRAGGAQLRWAAWQQRRPTWGPAAGLPWGCAAGLAGALTTADAWRG